MFPWQFVAACLQAKNTKYMFVIYCQKTNNEYTEKYRKQRHWFGFGVDDI